MPEAQIVWTVDEELPLTTFETTPFKLARRGESLKVEVNLVAEVENNFRKRAYVKPNLPNYQTFVVRSDERSEEHTSELQSLMRISYAVFCLHKKNKNTNKNNNIMSSTSNHTQTHIN